jgi:hypothetical protein
MRRMKRNVASCTCPHWGCIRAIASAAGDRYATRIPDHDRIAENTSASADGRSSTVHRCFPAPGRCETVLPRAALEGLVDRAIAGCRSCRPQAIR